MTTIDPFPQDILPMFEEGTPQRPLSRGEISWKLCDLHGIPVTNAHTANRAVAQQRLQELLDGWVKDEVLVKLTGQEWADNGVTWHGMLMRASYYTTISVRDQLDVITAQADEAARFSRARRLALDMLAERHPGEYRELCAQVKQRLDQQAAVPVLS